MRLPLAPDDRPCDVTPRMEIYETEGIAIRKNANFQPEFFYYYYRMDLPYFFSSICYLSLGVEEKNSVFTREMTEILL